MKDKRINKDGDYLIIAPQPDLGNYQMLTERTFLVDNLIAFTKNHPDIDPHQITVYELTEINLKQ